MADAQDPHAVEDTIFDKIVRGVIPCSKVYEDDLVLAFNDITPQAPVHIVLVPKHRQGLTRLSKAEDSHKALLGHLLWAAAHIARLQGLEPGWRLVINDGADAGQTVFHLHIHILSGRPLAWPPG
jgi:histidine triad (HIT) family protein